MTQIERNEERENRIQDEVIVDAYDAEEQAMGMLVEIELMGRTMGVPLYQLEPIDVDDSTRQVIEDWQYWIARGYQFG